MVGDIGRILEVVLYIYSNYYANITLVSGVWTLIRYNPSGYPRACIRILAGPRESILFRAIAQQCNDVV